MDVRISYAVNLDKVPEKVEEMLNEVDVRKAGQMVTLAMQMLELGHYDMGSTMIDEARQMLAKADRQLTDAQMILNGYTNAKKEPEAPTIPEPVSTPESPDVD